MPQAVAVPEKMLETALELAMSRRYAGWCDTINGRIYGIQQYQSFDVMTSAGVDTLDIQMSFPLPVQVGDEIEIKNEVYVVQKFECDKIHGTFALGVVLYHKELYSKHGTRKVFFMPVTSLHARDKYKIIQDESKHSILNLHG